jgi:polyisoprenoid-binding protein YceI
MKTTFRFGTALAIVFAIAAVFNTVGAKNYKINTKKSKVMVTGTSTLHDWESKLLNYSGDIDLQINDDKQIQEISSASFVFNTNSFNSGKNSMDKKTKESMKADKFPSISFKVDEIKDIKTINKKQLINATGKLTIAGVTKQVTINASCSPNAEGELVLDVKKEIDMTEFGIQPPEVLFIKSGKMITVYISMIFS